MTPECTSLVPAAAPVEAVAAPAAMQYVTTCWMRRVSSEQARDCSSGCCSCCSRMWVRYLPKVVGKVGDDAGKVWIRLVTRWGKCG